MNCCEISVFLQTCRGYYMAKTHFWPVDPILRCMGKTPSLERVAVKWVFPTDYFSLNIWVNMRNFGLPSIWSVGHYEFL